MKKAKRSVFVSYDLEPPVPVQSSGYNDSCVRYEKINGHVTTTQGSVLVPPSPIKKGRVTATISAARLQGSTPSTPAARVWMDNDLDAADIWEPSDETAHEEPLTAGNGAEEAQESEKKKRKRSCGVRTTLNPTAFH